jgi:PleD family two-component response regulator
MPLLLDIGIEELTAIADEHLYRAKEGGRNRVIAG